MMIYIQTDYSLFSVTTLESNSLEIQEINLFKEFRIYMNERKKFRWFNTFYR